MWLRFEGFGLADLLMSESDATERARIVAGVARAAGQQREISEDHARAARGFSQIVQAEVGMSLVRNERTREGQSLRRFYDLKLERTRTPVFAMSFQAMHRIDPSSPLYGMTHDDLEATEAELVVTVTGMDETMGATVHARGSYLPSEIRYRHRYVDIFGMTPEGRRAIDYRRYHLRHPPRGYEWRESNGSYIMVAIATGIIASAILSQGR